MTTSVPAIKFNPTGVVYPADPAILAGVLADLNAAFGGKLNIINLQTPQGQFAQTETAVVSAANANVALVLEQSDPATAEGIYQDAIADYYFLNRLPATPTTLVLLCSGASGFAIPNLSTVQDPSGNVYSTAGGTIGAGGTISLIFLCTQTGPVPVPGTVTIAPAINGWDSASVSSGAQGAAAESQQALETRRQQSVSGNSLQMIQSIQGALLKIPVASAYCYDNATGAPVSLAGVTVPASSIYICVAPGSATPAQIAQAIWSKKGGGCGYYGMSTVTGSISGNTLTLSATLTGAAAIGQQLFDTTGVLTGNPFITAGSGSSWTIGGPSQTVASETIYLVANTGVQVQDNVNYQAPFPKYVVAYQVAAPLPLAVAVTLKNSTQVPSNALALVQAAVAQAYAGVGGMPFAIGAQVFALNCSANIAALGTWAAQIISILIGSTASAAASTSGAISGTTLTVSSGTGIVAGQAVLDLTGYILPGTSIVSGSGTSWQVSLSQTLSSETLYFVAPASSSLTPNVNQMPQLNAANVSLTLA